MFVSHKESSLVVQPADGAFDLPARFVATQFPAVLAGGLLSVSPVWRDLVDVPICQAVAQPVGVGRFVVDQSWSQPLSEPHVDQSFDAANLGNVRFDRKGRQRNPVAVGHHQNFCSLAPFGLADFEPPFFAGENVPSPKSASQFSRFCRFT